MQGNRALTVQVEVRTQNELEEALEAFFGRRSISLNPGTVRNPYLKASTEASRQSVFEA